MELRDALKRVIFGTPWFAIGVFGACLLGLVDRFSTTDLLSGGCEPHEVSTPGSALFVNIGKAPPRLNSSNTAIVTAITGGIDQGQLEPGPNVFVYDESTEHLPFPRRDVNQRLSAKYFKMSTHWLHPESEAYIWVDGAFSIKLAELRSLLIEELGSADCAFFKHPDRQTIVQEMELVVNEIKKGAPGSEYLSVRYGNESMKEQVDDYIAQGFPVDEYPLLNGGLFIRRNLPHVNAAFDHWLIENFKWTIQDQLSLPYILWKHNLTWKTISARGGNIWSGPYHEWRMHAKNA
jgi:hypothetical protein